MYECFSGIMDGLNMGGTGSSPGFILMQFCLLPESELQSAGRLRGTEISLRVREISVHLKSQSAG